MARIRTVKPELFKHEELFDAELETGLPLRLAFIGLFTCCDREGRFKWRPRALKLDVLPYDDCSFDRVLDALWTRGFIVKYERDGEEFGAIPTFSKHQVINNRESQSSLPDPCENSLISPTSTRDRRVTDAIVTPHEGKGRGREQGREEEGKESSAECDGPPVAREAAKPKPSFDWETGKIVNLADAVIGKWQEAYPAINVRSEISKAEAWQLANPKNRKSDYVRFLNGWLSRAQDRAPRAGPGSIPLSERNRQAVQDHLAHRQGGPDTSWIIPDDDNTIDMEPQP